MADIEVVARVEDETLARSLIAALKAYGFHPLEGGDGGFPGATGLLAANGIPIVLPADEARDGKVLAEDLLREMLKR